MSDFQPLIDKFNEEQQANNKKKTDAKAEKKVYPPKLAYLEIKKPGVYRFRIFPKAENPMDLPYVKISRHFLFNPEVERNLPVHCNGKGCEECAYFTKLSARNDKDAWKYEVKNLYTYYGLNEKEQLAYISMNYYINEALTQKIVGNLKAGINVMDFNEGRWIELTISVTKDGKWVYSISFEEEHSFAHILRNQFLLLKPLIEMAAKVTNEIMRKILYPPKVDKTPNKEESQANSYQISFNEEKALKQAKIDDDMKKMREKMLKDEANESEIVDVISFELPTTKDVENEEKLKKAKDTSKKPVSKTKMNDSLWDLNNE